MNSAMILSGILIATTHATIQPYAVRGSFKCGDKPLTDSQVILYTEHSRMFRFINFTLKNKIFKLKSIN